MDNQQRGDGPPDQSKDKARAEAPTIKSTPTDNKIGDDPKACADPQNAAANELAREFRWIEVWTLAINGVLAIVGIVALCIYGGQLGVMKGQLGSMTKQLDQMTQQTKIMHQQIVGTQQAVLQVETREPYASANGISGGIHNVGKAVATHVSFRLELTRQRVDKNGGFYAIDKPVIISETPGPIAANATWPPFLYPKIWHVFWIHTPNPSVRRDTWPADWPGSGTTNIRTFVAYDNGFGERIESEQCLELLPMFFIKVRDNGTMTVGGIIPCAEAKTEIMALRHAWEDAKQ